MKTQQKIFQEDSQTWKVISTSENFDTNLIQIVLAFGKGELLNSEENFTQIKEFYPNAEIISCSTAGEILGTEIHENSIVLTAISFEKTKMKTVQTSIKNMSESKDVGERLAQKLPDENLTHVMVFSDGLNVNGSELIKGLKKIFPKTVAVTGGLAGDDANFKSTFVGLNEVAKQNNIVLVGFYGKNIKIGYGSIGGWDSFGSERVVTKSKGNVVYEVDNQPILDLYKLYLGEQAKDLPRSGLLFPLSIKCPDTSTVLVRTLLAIDEKEKSITFAGDIPEGCHAQLMKANFERLIDGAGKAAQNANILNSKTSKLAILISCVGRKLVLKQRTEEEIESVQSVLGKQCVLTGFYSYGEIAPTASNKHQCELHNQTMTVTTFEEF